MKNVGHTTRFLFHDRVIFNAKSSLFFPTLPFFSIIVFAAVENHLKFGRYGQCPGRSETDQGNQTSIHFV
jgi:hypothetical protein